MQLNPLYYLQNLFIGEGGIRCCRGSCERNTRHGRVSYRIEIDNTYYRLLETTIRKAIKHRGHFPNDEAAMKRSMVWKSKFLSPQVRRFRRFEPEIVGIV